VTLALFNEYMAAAKKKQSVSQTTRDSLIQLLHFKHNYGYDDLARMFKL